MLYGDLLPWITISTFLAYLPVLSYLDWKHRDIGTHKIWLPLIAINIPVVIAGYALGTYPLELALIAGIGFIAWLAMLYTKYLPGADFVFLALVSLFVVINPVSGMPFALMWTFYLVAFVAATFWWIFLDNLLVKKVWSIRPDNFPFLVPFSCAFVAAVFL
jgi:hypothetical protein